MAATALKSFIRRTGRSRLGDSLIRLLIEPPVGRVDWATLRRTVPVSRWFGLDRGKPVDRVYIEDFLAHHAVRIRGRVLEVGDDTYTRQFGGERVEYSDVLHAVPGNPAATIVADLTDALCIPDARYDCVVITQTLQCVFDVRAAVRTLHRILKPGGTALATLPGISQISRSDMNQWGDFWRFTSASSWSIFAEAFPDGEVTIKTYGNVLSAAAFLYGLTREDLSTEELMVCDSDYQVLLGVCAVKTGGAAGPQLRATTAL